MAKLKIRPDREGSDETVVGLNSPLAASLKRKKRHADPRYMAKVRERMIAIAIAIINRNHGFVLNGHDAILSVRRDYRGRRVLKYWSKNVFYDVFASKQIRLPKVGQDAITFEYVNPARIWFNDKRRREIEGVINAPGEFLSGQWFNMWEGWGTTPLLKERTPDYSGEKCRLIISHIVKVWCSGNETIARWVLAWLANIIQYPQNKPGTAIMMYSGQGTGKSFIIEHVLAKILGTGYGYESSAEFLTARFNDCVEGKLLIYADEAFFHGDRSASDRLKAFVTAKEMGIEKKQQNKVTQEHHARLIATTNHTHAMSVDNDDRRWLIMEASEDRKKDYTYFDALMAEIEAGGAEAFHAFLMNPALLDDINLKEAPQTKAMLKQKIKSLDSAEGFIYECLHAGTIQLGHSDEFRHEWPDTVGKAEWYKAYCDWCKVSNHKWIIRDSQFGEIIKKVLKGIKDGRSGSANRHWKLPDLQQARKLFSNWLGCPPDRDYMRVIWEDWEGDEPGVSDEEYPAKPAPADQLAALFGPKEPLEDCPF